MKNRQELKQFRYEFKAVLTKTYIHSKDSFRKSRNLPGYGEGSTSFGSQMFSPYNKYFQNSKRNTDIPEINEHINLRT